MDKVALRPVFADAVYEARFSAFHFGLLANPVPIYQSLLRTFGPDGATLDSLRIEAASVAGANIACVLDFATIRLRIDKLEVQVPRLGDGSPERISHYLLKGWKVLEAVEPSAILAEHSVSYSGVAVIDGEFDYVQLSRRFLVSSILERARGGVVLQFGEDAATQIKIGGLSIDGVDGFDKAVRMRGNAIFHAAKLPIDAVMKRFEQYLAGALESLGIAFQWKAEA